MPFYENLDLKLQQIKRLILISFLFSLDFLGHFVQVNGCKKMILSYYIKSFCVLNLHITIYIILVYSKSEDKYLRNISVLFWYHSSFESTTQKWSTSIWCQLLRLKVESIKKTCHHVSVKENISEIGHFFSILVTDNVNLNIFFFSQSLSIDIFHINLL